MTTEAATDGRRARLTIRSFRVLAVLLGALHAAAAIAHQSMNEDGISYLDLGDAWWRGEFREALSSAWSPLYPIVLGGALRLVRPSPEREFALVHVVDFGLFLIALLAFEFLWREIAVAAGIGSGTAGGATGGGTTSAAERRVGLPAWAWWSAGYALFLWTSLGLIEIWAVTPDMLVAALVFLAGGLLLRAERTGSEVAAVGFGAALGLGYLAKSVMLPLGAAALALAWPTLRRAGARPGGAKRTALALSAFLVLAAALVGALGAAHGRFTIGDAGRLTYLRYVNGVPYPHWRPEEAPEGVGSPLHPARRVMESPEAYAFGEPVPGTYPLSYDPGYWYEGVRPRLSLAEQAAALYGSGRTLFELLAGGQAGPLAAAVVLVGVGGLRRAEWRWDARWSLAGLAVAAFGLYALVYVEGRYVGPFVVLLWGGLLSHLRIPDGEQARRLLASAGAVAALFPLLHLAALDAEGAAGMLGLARQPGAEGGAERSTLPSAGRPSEVAAGLAALDLRPGDRIAVVGDAFGFYAARLARLRIVAEVPERAAGEFWSAPEPVRRETIRRLAAEGIRAVVAVHRPPGEPPGDWRPAGEEGPLVLLVRSNPETTSPLSPGSP